jgi:protein-S-isoprenylcysteine O-methyltransferase Ste14
LLPCGLARTGALDKAMHFPPTPTGWPGIVALMAGGVVFGLLVVAARIRNRRSAGGGSRSRRSVVGIAIQMIAFTLTGAGRLYPDLAPASPPAIIEAFVVTAMVGTAVWLFTASTRSLGANWSLEARVRDEHELITGGPFAHMRHPIYAAMLLFLVAMAIAIGHLMQLVIAIPLFAIGTMLRVREEERLLRDKFGAEFDAYAARVTRFVPGLF